MSRVIALIGCGAIAQAFYLPALARCRPKFDRVWLVDPSDRALAAANSIVPGMNAHRLSEVTDDVEFIIVAAPNALHFSLTEEALLRGAHVLVEKPFVIRPEEGDKLAKLGNERNRVVAVNQTRRVFPYVSELRRRIASGEFGGLRSVVHHEGEKLAWPFESGAAFARGAQRTGVIVDLGVHVLDYYNYLIEPSWAFASAVHDGFQGPEGLAGIELLANGAPVSIRLSRYLKLGNRARLSFERAEISVNVYDLNACAITDKTGKVSYVRGHNTAADHGTIADHLLANFLAAGNGSEQPVCSASSSLPTIRLIDEIYEGATRYPSEIGMV